MPLRTRGGKRGAACWPKWWLWETVRNAPGAWPKQLPISLALPKLQGNADQVAGAAQGVKMDFWTVVQFFTVLVGVIVVTLAARSKMSGTNKLLVQALTALAVVTIMGYMPHVQKVT